MNKNKHFTVAPRETEILIVDVIPKIEYHVVPKAEAIPGVIDDEIVPEQFIPTSSLYLEDYIRPQELLICRACLLSECRLYSMRGHNLEEIYRCLTNIQWIHNDNIPLLLCAKCACFLDKCQQFRQKTNAAQERLNSLAFPVTYKQIRETYDKVNKEFSSLTVRQMPPDHYDYCISESCNDGATITSDIKDEIKSDDNGHMDDQLSSNIINDESDDDEPLANINKNSKTQEDDKEPKQIQAIIKNKSNVRKPRKQPIVRGHYIRHNLINKFTKQVFTLEEQIAAVQKRKDSYSYKFFKYKCDICYVAFNQEKKHKEHMAKHDKDYSNHLCNVCKLRFKNHTTLLEHKRTHKSLYSCVHCFYTTNVRDNAVFHIPKHEDKYQSGEVLSKTGENKPRQGRWKARPAVKNVRVVCEVCGKSMQIGNLKGHMDEHEGKIFKCEACGKVYNNSRKYEIHVVDYHTGIKPTCPYCGKEYSTKWIMRRHIAARHTITTTRYPCDVCSRPFKTKYALKMHFNCVHLKIKPFRKPKEKKPVVKAKPEPDPAKPFVCEHCHKGFKNKPYLQQHLNYVHYKKPRSRGEKTKPKTKVTALDGRSDQNKPDPVS